MLRIPIKGLNPQSYCLINKEDTHAELLWATSLIIWDKVPMKHHFGPEAVSHTLMDICDDPCYCAHVFRSLLSPSPSFHPYDFTTLFLFLYPQ